MRRNNNARRRRRCSCCAAADDDNADTHSIFTAGTSSSTIPRPLLWSLLLISVLLLFLGSSRENLADDSGSRTYKARTHVRIDGNDDDNDQQQQHAPTTPAIRRPIASVAVTRPITVDTDSRNLQSQSVQPRVVRVETIGATKLFGSISKPEGSVWCQGRPTYWLVGHQHEDFPWCYNAHNDTWTPSLTTRLDRRDLKNRKDGPFDGIDRHDCAALDVNNDGVPDIACGVGVDKGKGHGYNELYLTNPSDGSVKKVREHGFQKYTTLRTRLLVTLTSAIDQKPLLFITTNGNERDDNKPSPHVMFRYVGPDKGFFQELDGPCT